MKIVAYSLVPASPLPYLHLGYISATIEQSIPFFGLTVMLALVSAVAWKVSRITCTIFLVLTIICYSYAMKEYLEGKAILDNKSSQHQIYDTQMIYANKSSRRDSPNVVLQALPRPRLHKGIQSRRDD